MPPTYIGTSSTEQLKNEVRLAVSHAKDALQDLTLIAAVMNTMLDTPEPAPAGFTLIESKYGLASGKGEAFYTLIKNARDRITHANIRDLVERLG